jgi:arabinose-5-phosphate isomerase
MNVLEIALETLESEIVGLQSLKEILDDNFIEISHKIANCKGRVIISGVGKSGHIGAKISSTMSSIGIPSFFMHPSEASHGDLGMILKEDIVILISNSGETKEFANLISFLKTEKISSVSITRSKFSTLYNSSDYKIVMPSIPEAISYGAPTTSTTQTLAIGDILSVCASKIKNFTATDYAKIHPGGKLGLSLIKIETVMRKGSETAILPISTNIKEVISKMQSGFAILVDENQKLMGVLSDGDIRRGILNFENIATMSLEKIITKSPKTLHSSETLIRAVEIFNEYKIGTIVILDSNEKVIGSLDRKDISF